MSRPTDAELNRAMAEACGWKDIQDHAYTPSGIAVCGTVPDDRPSPWNNRRHYIPRYCVDRDTLPDILNAVEAAGKQWAMATRLDKDISKGVVESAWIMWRLPMREVVIAALRALGRWPDDWGLPE